MDAKTKFKAERPGRHVTEGPERVRCRSHYFAIGLAMAQIHQPFVGAAEVFKKTPCVADLKPGGRHVAKDMIEARGEVGDALHGAVTHPAGAAEKMCYADI